MSSLLDPSHTFASLSDDIGLDYRLRKAVARMGHIRPTLVQSKCLPLAISSGRDLVVRAKTGSGKTLAYCLPTLQKILTKKSSTINVEEPATTADHSSNKNQANLNDNARFGVSAVILVPTTELCSQVYQQIQQLTYYCDDVISCALLSIGQARRRSKGTSEQHHLAIATQQELDKQEALLRDHPDVIVATPNGLLTHIRSGILDLQSSVETLVVDEADLVLSLGNSSDMTEIVKSLPRIYQGMLMSATLSPELESLKKIVLNSPITLKLEQDDDLEGHSNQSLKQFYLRVPKQDKNLVLYVFLKLGLLKGKGLFFVNSTDSSYRLKLFLEQFHIRSAVLNAELPMRSRLNIIEQFNVGNFDYLIATDTSTDTSGNAAISVNTVDGNDNNDSQGKKSSQQRAQSKKQTNSDDVDDYGVARGMDFHRVSFVVNFDLPPSPKSYAHRIGRTARGVAHGVALTFVHAASSEHDAILRSIQESQPDLTVGCNGIPMIMASDHLHAAPEAAHNGTGPGSELRKRQPVALDFDLQEIEGFRYRVEDVQRAVTKSAVRETRAAELKAEILNSERLQGHFEENPKDLQLLAHDRLATNVSKVQAHLRHVPKYLLPRGMQVANLNKKKRKKKIYDYDRKNCNSGITKSVNDPLRTYVDAVEGEHDNDPLADFMKEDDDDDDNNNKKKKKQKTTSDGSENINRVFADTTDGTGYSTSNRRAWQEKHKKGPFNMKKKKTSKYKPLGI